MFLILVLPARADGNEDCLVPFAALETMENADGDQVAINASEPGKLRVAWNEGDEARDTGFDAPSREAAPTIPPLPVKLQEVPPAILKALHECGRTVRSDSVRPPLSRVQLCGKRGEVVGTDGLQLLVFRGFAFPFADDRLVPAVPVFGGREWAAETAVRIGQSATHVFVEAGPWIAVLTIDGSVRFPDVSRMLPKSQGAAQLQLSEADAEALSRLCEEAGDRGESPPRIHLQFGPRPKAIATIASSARKSSVPLGRSQCTGATMTVALARRFLARAIQLGFRRLQVDEPGGQVFFREDDRAYLVAGLSPDPTERLSSSDGSASATRKGDKTMTPKKNGDASHGAADTEESLDPLIEAEAVREAMAELGRRLGRLMSSLRQFHRQRRVFQTVASQYLSRNR
jgi:hypothetical protein